MRRTHVRTSASASVDSSPSLESSLAIRKTGYLHRKGRYLRRWRQRYFVLDDFHLRYYNEIREMQDGAAPNGIISLSNCTVHDGGVSETFGSRRIHLSDGQAGKIHIISGESASDVDDWLALLTETIQKRSHTPTMNDGPATPAAPQPHGPLPPSHLKSKFPPALRKAVAVKIDEFRGLVRRRDAWRLLFVENGTRVSLLRGSTIVKGTCVVSAAAGDVCRLLLDSASRVEWDPHFSDGRTLQSFGPRSRIVKLTGRVTWRRPHQHAAVSGPGTFADSLATGIAVGLGASLGSIGAEYAGVDPSVGAVVGAAFVGALAAGPAPQRGARGTVSAGPFTIDAESLASQRELVLLRHGVEYEPGKFYIPEWSVEHASAPLNSFVRAHSGIGGFFIENMVQQQCVRSQVTYIADFDPKGWLPESLRRAASLERLRCLDGIRELVAQTIDDDVYPARDGQDLSDVDDDDGAWAESGDESVGDAEEAFLEVGQIAEHKGGVSTAPPMTWAQCPDVHVFKVRGPQYVNKQHEGYKVKQPSEFAMYEAVAVDMFKTAAKDKFVWKRFKRPADLDDGNTAGVPNTLVVLQILPDYQVSVFGSQDDGPSHNLLLWFKLSDRAKAMLTGKETPTNGIQLLKDWSKQGDPLHPQWKTICQLQNPGDIDAGAVANGMLKSYNGKPFLSNISHTVQNDGNTLAVISDVHSFGYMLKNFYYNNQDICRAAVVDMAYVVEGREADHLPEQILAAVRLHNLDIGTARTL